MNKDFTLFQSEFKKWQKLFGLTGYQILFEYIPLDGSFASIAVNQGEMTVTVKLSNELSEDASLHKDIKRDAKHEAIHLLLAKLEHLAKSRYTTEDEIYEADEELAYKLEDLIP